MGRKDETVTPVSIILYIVLTFRIVFHKCKILTEKLEKGENPNIEFNQNKHGQVSFKWIT
jgi:hypothetical protein